MTEYLGRQFHRQVVGKAKDESQEQEGIRKKKEQENKAAQEAIAHREKTFKEGKSKDAEPVASGEYSADADLIPIDDKALS